MPRKVRDANLENRSQRSKLRPGRKPYYRLMEQGLHIGYRKPVSGGAGRWVVRFYRGGEKYQVKAIDGAADDFADADGKAILNFGQAQEQARLIASRPTSGAAISTVAEAMAYYLKDRHTADSEWRSRAHIVPALGETKIVHLTTDRIRDWHRAMAKEAPRLRTKQGEAQQHRKTANDDEAKRRRRSSANRTLTILKAALNHAWRDKKITSNDEWKRVKPFESVDAARVRYLSLAEARRLVNACEPDFRQLVQAALETGARYGKLTTLKVSDFNPDSGTVSVATTSGNKRGSHVVLTDEGRAFFKRVCAGRAGSEFMFRKATEVKDPNTGKSTIEYSAWGKSHQKRPMQEAVERAKITPAISFHGLRHTWASLAVMEGVPLLVVAKNLGHTDTRMVEKHYGHLAPSYIAEAIREKAPRYGFKPDRKIASLAG